MISVLAQERLLGAALGCAFTGFLVFDQRRCIYRSISEIRKRPIDSTKAMVPDSETSVRSDVAHLWNKTVDKTLGPLIHALSSRGWVVFSRTFPPWQMPHHPKHPKGLLNDENFLASPLPPDCTK